MEQSVAWLPQSDSLKVASIVFEASRDLKSAKKKAKAMLKVR
jgi:hypothetical protein